MTAGPDDVTAPADGAMLFRVSRPWSLARMFGIFVVTYLVVQPLVGLVLGGDHDPWWVLLLRAVVLSTLGVGLLSFMHRSPVNTWVRTSAGGLEICAGGSDPILLPWADVAAAVIRRRGPRTVLEVTPVEMSRVHRAEVHHGLPRVRDGAFVADVGLLRPRTSVLGGELTRCGVRG